LSESREAPVFYPEGGKETSSLERLGRIEKRDNIHGGQGGLLLGFVEGSSTGPRGGNNEERGLSNAMDQRKEPWRLFHGSSAKNPDG